MMDAAGERKDKEDIMRTIAIINLKGGVAKTTYSYVDGVKTYKGVGATLIGK